MTVHHVSLETRRDDVGAALALWALLGFERVQPPPTLRERAAWVQRGATQVHLLFADDPVAMPPGHVAVAAEDFDAPMERMRAAGFEPRARAAHRGAARAYVNGPGGHLVEVMAFPPPLGDPWPG